MMGEVMQSPDFPQHELDRVRRERLTDLRRSKDEPNVIAERLVAGLVYPAGSGYAHPVGGTEASVQAITRDDLVAQFRRAYRPDNAHLLVVGDVEREEVMRRAAQFSARGTVPAPMRPAGATAPPATTRQLSTSLTGPGLRSR